MEVEERSFLKLVNRSLSLLIWDCRQLIINYKLGKGDIKSENLLNHKQAIQPTMLLKAGLLDLQKQAALIETTGKKTAEVTELEKVNFDITSGNLKSIIRSAKRAAPVLRLKSLDSKKEELTAKSGKRTS
ncbi:hypothetical protein ACB311_27845 [Klebsiella pneumoniae]